MKKLLEVTYLYDFYGKLLTPKQNNILRQYYLEDLSLSEIAEVENVSRQSIHETIKQSEKKLRQYDEKLNLVERFKLQDEKINNAISKIDSLLNKIDDKNLSSEILDIKHNMQKLLNY